MGLFSSCSNKKNIELICDIGNGSIGVALVEYLSSEKAPNILFSERLFSHTKREKNLENSLAVFTKDLNTLLNNALSHAVTKNIRPLHISCFYSSPWFVSQIQTLRVKQSEPVLFNQSVLDKILKDSESHFLSDKEGKASALAKENLVLAERRITRIRLNGYGTHKPFGKKASEIEASVFLSAISAETISAVEDSIKRIWRGAKIEHHTFPMASFAMFRNVLNTYGSFLMVYIARDITDVSLVHDEILVDTVSFPLGKGSVIERIEQECKLDYGLASSAFSMYVKKDTPHESVPNLNKAIESVRKDWITHFENSCAMLVKDNLVPPAMYIVANEKALSFFEETIKSSAFGGSTNFNKEMAVFPVDRNIFDKYVTFESATHKDLFLETEALYINLISNSQKKITDNYILE